MLSKTILMDETDMKLLIFLVDKINGRWQVKGKLSHLVEFAVCRKRVSKSLYGQPHTTFRT